MSKPGGPPEYVLEQRITPVVNKYSVLAGHDGELGLVAFGDVPFPLRYHFEVLGAGGRSVGSYHKITTFRDHYRLAPHDRLRSTSGCCSACRSRWTRCRAAEPAAVGPTSGGRERKLTDRRDLRPCPARGPGVEDRW